MHQNRQGFTLLEVAIVLTTIALVAGGVLAGRTMVRNAKLQSIMDDAKLYANAVRQFKDKYQEMPGDFSRATAVWGHAGGGTCSNNTATPAAAPGTCDGDGNGVMEYTNALTASNANVPEETFLLWQHLSLAGLIQGTYTGRAGLGPRHHVFGTNAPATKIEGVGWGASYGYDSTLDVCVVPSPGCRIFAHDYQNWFTVGVPLVVSGSPIGIPATPFLRTQEAHMIDIKIDDGKPGTGDVHSSYWIHECTNATSSTDIDTTYKLADSTTNRCALLFNTFTAKGL